MIAITNCLAACYAERLGSRYGAACMASLAAASQRMGEGAEPGLLADTRDAMHSAFLQLMGRSPFDQSECDREIMRRAFRVARQAGFDADRIRCSIHRADFSAPDGAKHPEAASAPEAAKAPRGGLDGALGIAGA